MCSHLCVCVCVHLSDDTNLTAMLYRVRLFSGFQLQGQSFFLQRSVTAISRSLDLDARRHVDFPFQTKPR